jgi:eukaryotic-like serine/threonine-protein kinase
LRPDALAHGRNFRARRRHCAVYVAGAGQGRKLDARSDIFSFGAVLYEMVTGRRAFRGDSTAATLAAVLHHEPEPASQVPHELERIIHRCLRKDPNRRFHSMNDVRVELEEVREDSESGMQAVIEAPGRKRRTWTYAIAAAALLSAAVLAVFSLRRPQLPGPSQPVPLTSYLGDQEVPDLSPDANQVVFAWNGENRSKYHIYIKPVALAGYLQLTKGDAEEFYPKWSPDGQWIAFQRRDSTGLHTFLMSPIGGSERKLRDGGCIGLSWSSDSKALACGADKGLLLISAETGDARQLTFPPNGKQDVFPTFSPDGRRLLFIEGGRRTRVDCDLYLLELKSDLSARAKPRRVTNERANDSGRAAPALAWTADGRAAIWAMSETSPYAMTLYRVPVLRAGPIEPLPFAGWRVSYPAVRRNRLVYSRWSVDIDIWRADGHTAERYPVSSTEVEYNPQFSPDAKHIALESNRSGAMEIWVANSDGTEPVQFSHFGWSGSPTWSPDGRWIAFNAYTASSRWDLWVAESGGGKPRRLTDGPGSSGDPSFSHDGNWVYFGNDRTGHSEVFRMPFSGGQTMQITRSGGACPQESSDGKTIYYLDSRASSAALIEAPASGGPEHLLGITVASRAFHVVVDGIYFIAPPGKDGSGFEIRFYDFATHRSRLIQALGDINNWLGFAVSPDRKTFLYSVEQDNGRNLMLVENFR